MAGEGVRIGLNPGEKHSIFNVSASMKDQSALRFPAPAIGAFLLGLAVLAGAALDAGASNAARRSPLRRFEFSLARMGTTFNIVLYHTEEAEASKAAMEAFGRVERLEAIFSDFREDSENRRLCRLGAGMPHAVSPELFFVLENSLRFSQLSGGAFDVTIGPLVQVWREARRAGRAPDPGRLAEARKSTGIENVILDSEQRTVHLLLPNMRLDFGGIAKGYAADEALRVLKSHGIRIALVDGGGDISIGSAPPGQAGWRIEVKNGLEAPGERASLVLHDRGVATSGDLFQFLESGGVRYSHIVDPASAVALKNSPGVTVVARDGMTADALATALSVTPADQGMSLVESVDGASAAIVTRGERGAEWQVSRGFPPLVRRHEAPRTAPPGQPAHD
jgi:FAD:protein FMN transferase